MRPAISEDTLTQLATALASTSVRPPGLAIDEVEAESKEVDADANAEEAEAKEAKDVAVDAKGASGAEEVPASQGSPARYDDDRASPSARRSPSRSRRH